MKFTLKRLALAIVSTGLLTIYGCGGGGSDAVVATTDLPITVVDGPIENALVCLDKNGNGICDAGEPTGKTDATGKVTLKIDSADVGKYAILAVVGTDAKDADTGLVPVPFTLKAPADRPAVVSPLTTLVQTAVESGHTTASAEDLVKSQTGIKVSLFEDFTKSTSADSKSASTVARLVVVTTQQQTAALILAGAIGSTAIDGSRITKELLDQAIQKRVLDRMTDLRDAAVDPAVLAAGNRDQLEALLRTQAAGLVTGNALTITTIKTVVAVNVQASAPPVAPPAPTAGINLVSLNFIDASNFFTRVITGSLAQNTPDANGNVRYVDRRARSVAGNLAKWNTGADPARQSDLHWNGSVWANCALNGENVSSVRDAQGNNSYNYCDGAEIGKSNRAAFDVTGQSMLTIYNQARDAGFTNLAVADTAALGSATFPTGSTLFYQRSTPITQAIGYYPGGSFPVGTSNVVTQYSAAVSAGGVASTQAALVACNSAEARTSGTNSTTLEGLIGAMTGTPCVYPQGNFKYPTTASPVTTSTDANDESWGYSTVGIGVIGTAPVGTGASAPGYYSGNNKLRVAFTGTGTNPVTYYSCKERFNNGGTRNCTVIGTGTYAIATLGDARVLTLNNLPSQASPLNYTRVFVERGGLVYGGYQNKPNVANSARLNSTAANALLTQLGLPVENPSVPLALTAGSYQGVWEVRDPTSPAGTGLTMSISPNGSVSCTYHGVSSTSTFVCTLAFTDLATGAFAFRDTTVPDGTAIGTFNFLAGTGSGTHHDTTNTPVDGNFVAQRR